MVPPPRPPPTFEDFHRRCLKVCGKRKTPENGSCDICTEEYDQAEHRAVCVKVKHPTPCNHVFCETCLRELFSRRRTQDGANKCPLCRAVWFAAEFESVDAQRTRIFDRAENLIPASGDGHRTVFTIGDWELSYRPPRVPRTLSTLVTRPLSALRGLSDVFGPSAYSRRRRPLAQPPLTPESPTLPIHPPQIPTLDLEPSASLPPASTRVEPAGGYDVYEFLTLPEDDGETRD